MEEISLEWFFKMPGLLIVGGVLLILLAIIILIVSGRGNKGSKEEKDEKTQQISVTPISVDEKALSQNIAPNIDVKQEPIINIVPVETVPAPTPVVNEQPVTPISPAIETVKEEPPVISPVVENIKQEPIINVVPIEPVTVISPTVNEKTITENVTLETPVIPVEQVIPTTPSPEVSDINKINLNDVQVILPNEDDEII